MSVLVALQGGVGEDKAGAETGSGVDDAALGAALVGAETGAGVDDASLAAALAGVETAAGADNATLTADLSESDTGSGADAATLATDLAGSETGSGVDDAALGADLVGTDTGLAADDAALTASLTGSDSGIGADDASLALESDADTGAGVDDASLEVTLTAAETGAGVDDALLEVVLTAAETGAGSDDASLTVDLSGSEAGVGVDDGTVDVGASLEGSESGAGVDAATLEALGSGADTGAGVDDASLEVTLTTSGAGGAFQSDAFQSDGPGGESGVGVDDASVTAAFEGTETGVGLDASPQLDKGETGPAAEVGAGGETARVSKFGAALPTPGAAVTDVKLLYDNIDLWADVLRDSARFTAAANGAPGSCVFRVRDDGHIYDFVVGRDLQLTIADQIYWTGYIASVRRGFFTIDSKGADQRERYFEIQGIDLNALFMRRVLLDKVTPTNMQLTTYPSGTDDDVIVKQYMADHLDLSGDGLTDTLVENVGTPSSDSDISGAAGWSWGELMQFLTRDTGALYYIDPLRNVVLTDVDTPNAPFGISDDPGAGEIGCRELEIDFDGSKLRNDTLAWGMGQGAAVPVFKRTTDQPSIDEHNLWQTAVVNPTVWTQPTIDRISDSHVYGSPQSKRGGKDDAVAARCVVFEPGLRVGMKVVLRSAVFGFTDTLPIRSMEVDFPTAGPRFRLVLSHEIDAPWTSFEFWMPALTFPSWSGGLGGLGGLGGGWNWNWDPNWGWPDPSMPSWWPPFDPCFPAGGWTHEAGSGGNPELSQLFVNGGFGNFEAEIGSFASFYNWFEAGITRPTETLTRVLMRWTEEVRGAGFSCTVLFDSAGGPINSTSWAYLSLEPDLVSAGGPSGPYTYQLGVVWDTSDINGSATTLTNIEVIAADDNTQVEWDLWVRCRVEDGVARARVWENGDTEPGAWSLETEDPPSTFPDPFASSGLWLRGGAYDTINRTSIRVAEHNIVEGCTGGGMCGDDFEDPDSTSGWPGGSTVGELMGLFGSAETETFSRTTDPDTDPGWGASEAYGPQDWTHVGSGVGTRIYVDGSRGIMDDTPGITGKARLELPPFTSVPHDFLLLLEFENGAPDSRFMYMDMYSNVDDVFFEVLWEFAGELGDEIWLDFSAFTPTEFGADTIQALLLSPPAVNSPFWTRIRIEDDAIRIRAWYDGETEPSTWQAESESVDYDWSAAIGLIDLLEVGGLANVEGEPIVFDRIELGEGGNPCGTEDEPDPDPPRGAVCEDLTQRTDPPGYPTGPTYFAASTQWYPGTERVWLDGKLLRRAIDYDLQPASAWIGIDGSIDTTGKTVYMCYTAANLAIVTL